MKSVDYRKKFYLLASIFVLALFGYITVKTPLAGDDWGYALNGVNGNPLRMALSFYQSWSGRFFSELWGMIVPANRWIWNIVNPLLFAGILVGIYKLSGVNKYPVLSCLLILGFMLSVDDNLRMETYSWIMGTTYIVPLFFSLVYFVVIEKVVVENRWYVGSLLGNVLLFITGLMMENIAAVMIGGIAILLIYCWFNNRKAIKYLLVNLFFSSLSFLIMRMSPGSAYRLLNEHQAWNELSLFGKLLAGYPNFLQMTFINNNYAIGLFSLVLICLVLFSKKKVGLVLRLVPVSVLLLGVVSVFSFVFGENILNNASSLYSMVFWPLYIVVSFSCLWLFLDGYGRDKAIYFLVIAGAGALVMLYSPIYGSRSAIYTVYYLIVVAVLVLESVEFDKRLVFCGFCVFLLVIIGDRTLEYVNKYRLVGLRDAERLEIISYYRSHPEDEEAWIPRFPIYSIHGADIEEGDTYHFETFKEYYGLPQSADSIVFYFVEEQ